MKKRTLCGFDLTPRRSIWQRIARLEGLLAERERQLAATELTLKSMRLSLGRAEAERIHALRECGRLKTRLAKYDRKRGANGRFIPVHEPGSDRSADA